MRRHRLLLAIPSLGLIGLLAAAVSTTPSGPRGLLGCTPDQVIAAYGVPDDSSSSAGVFTLTWRTKAGANADFVFCGDAAVSVPDGFEPGATTAPKPGQPYLGQSAGAAAVCMGNPTDMSMGTVTTQLEYADDRVLMLAHGRVLGVTSR